MLPADLLLLVARLPVEVRENGFDSSVRNGNTWL
jgi:hypothetical protein